MALTIKVEGMSNNLTFYDRQKLEYWLRTKQSLRAVAHIMRRDHSVLVRELNRNANGCRKKYRADTAQRLYEKRKRSQHKGKLDKQPKLKEYVEEKLNEDWSPEEIAGRLKVEGQNETISHESIYHHIYDKSEKEKKLYKHLRTHRIKRQKQGQRKTGKICIPERISIHGRPQIVETRKRYGDWESDTVEFKRGLKNPFLSVQFERKSKLVRMHKTLNKSAEENNNAIVKTIESLPSEIFKTITFDNGSENVKHTEIKKEYGVETYFCDAYSSWQKGGVENTNKLIRQYLPKHTDLTQLTDREVYDIQEKLNNRPRKSLNYQTPNEVIHKVVH